MEFEFDAKLVEWRGPPPYVFAPLPLDIATEIRALGSQLSYGWGCIPLHGRIGATSFYSALFPKNGTYYLPVKVAVQRAEGVALGDDVHVKIWFEPTGS